MLAAAHVLAMDAKNLLDVVDAIKHRYETIFEEYFQVNLVIILHLSSSLSSRFYNSKFVGHLECRVDDYSINNFVQKCATCYFPSRRSHEWGRISNNATSFSGAFLSEQCCKSYCKLKKIFRLIIPFNWLFKAMVNSHQQIELLESYQQQQSIPLKIVEDHAGNISRKNDKCSSDL